MQSGKAGMCQWLLEYDQDPEQGGRFITPLIGWTGSSDMRQELRLAFDTQDEAVAFARKHHLSYEILEWRDPPRILRSYSDNFK